MVQPVNWTNPYSQTDGRWLQGNLHLHTTRSDGEIRFEDAVGVYKQRGYDFLAITDHNIVNKVGVLHTGIVVFAGIEADFSHRHHMNIIHPYGGSIYYRRDIQEQELIDINNQRGCLVFLNHPDWGLEEHYSIDDLFRLHGYDGIEIYNSEIEKCPGFPLSTRKWDQLLSSGRRVLGFACQDTHLLSDVNDCCTIVRVQQHAAMDIFEALKSGIFYCHFGVEILDLGRIEDTVFVNTGNAECVRFIGKNGQILLETYDREATCSFSGNHDSPYICIECYGASDSVSWTQPFFRF